MGVFVQIIKVIYAVFFMFAGITHLVKPKIFNYFIPNFLPKRVVNYLVGIIEFGLGFGLLFRESTEYAALGIIVLMILFLPIHIWDYTKTRPAIGSKKMALIRIPLQFLLIYCAYLIYTRP